jgi:hypothetical protein
MDLFKLDIELSAAIHAVADSKDGDVEINRRWRDDVYRRFELRGVVFDRTRHPLYDMGVIS